MWLTVARTNAHQSDISRRHCLARRQGHKIPMSMLVTNASPSSDFYHLQDLIDRPGAKGSNFLHVELLFKATNFDILVNCPKSTHIWCEESLSCLGKKRWNVDGFSVSPNPSKVAIRSANYLASFL